MSKSSVDGTAIKEAHPIGQRKRKVLGSKEGGTGAGSKRFASIVTPKGPVTKPNRTLGSMVSVDVQKSIKYDAAQIIHAQIRQPLSALTNVLDRLEGVFNSTSSPSTSYSSPTSSSSSPSTSSSSSSSSTSSSSSSSHSSSSSSFSSLSSSSSPSSSSSFSSLSSSSSYSSSASAAAAVAPAVSAAAVAPAAVAAAAAAPEQASADSGDENAKAEADAADGSLKSSEDDDDASTKCSRETHCDFCRPARFTTRDCDPRCCGQKECGIEGVDGDEVEQWVPDRATGIRSFAQCRNDREKRFLWYGFVSRQILARKLLPADVMNKPGTRGQIFLPRCYVYGIRDTFSEED